MNIASNRRWLLAGLLLLHGVFEAFAGRGLAAGIMPPAAVRPWEPAFLHDVAAWPHAERDARISTSPAGLRVQVPEGRRYAIAAASRLHLPAKLGHIRVRVAEVAGGGRWFVRLYGELREPGQARTVGVAQDEVDAGERMFPLDPRLRRLPESPLQVQLGVEGPAGACAVFADVAFLPASPRPNCEPSVAEHPGQRDIATVELMPRLPEPFQRIDWREKARAYDRFVFDHRAQGEFLPLVWIDESRIHIDRPTFGLQTYVGSAEQAKGKRDSQEGINCMGAVLGATLVGIDKSRQEHDYVAMCEAWFNPRTGLVLNRQQAGTGGSFWYELFPHVVFFALADRYPNKPRLAEIMRCSADRWQEACVDLADARGVPDFNHTSYDFATRKAADNGRWREPDAAAAVAWLQYAAFRRFGDAKYLAAAENCLKYLEGLKTNPYYEILLPFGALTAARINAEQGRQYDVARLVDWCFDVSDTRGGWAVTVGNWGGYDCDGLLGSIDNRCGYAFAMNTFVQAGALMPLARYEPRYARALGKWMLNLANAARLFYPGNLPAGHATCEFWNGDPQHTIAYEGLRYAWQGKIPCATGDPVAMRWGPKTDLGLYGSSFVGMLGAIVRPTNEPRILQLDCLATDFFHGRAWPTFLYYNPHAEPRSVAVSVGDGPVRIYDAVSKRFLAENVRGSTTLVVPADGAVLAVVVPATVQLRRDGRRLLLGDAEIW